MMIRSLGWLESKPSERANERTNELENEKTNEPDYQALKGAREFIMIKHVVNCLVVATGWPPSENTLPAKCGRIPRAMRNGESRRRRQANLSGDSRRARPNLVGGQLGDVSLLGSRVSAFVARISVTHYRET